MKRQRWLDSARQLLARSPVVAILGPRQCGKTTLARELDLLTFIAGKRHGFEAKRSDAPSMTKSMHVALADLGLEHLWVLHPGSREIRLHERVTAIGLDQVSSKLRRLRA